MPTEEIHLRDAVYRLMAELPVDKVTTYGDLAAMVGHPNAARIVGGIAHGGPDKLPWHRLVNAAGGLAVGFPGGQDVQRQLLAQDGIDCDDSWHVKDFGERRWRPQAYDPKPPLVVIVGPTASGKTALAIEMAKRFDGEIICADSRTIYKGMDIGTAKPTATEQAETPHWGLDLVEPGERFTAADFQQYANNKIAAIRRRGKVPFLVGGTGLYVDSVLFDYQFGAEPDPERRRVLEAMTLSELHKYCENNNILLPENSSNKRYVIRAIEQKTINNRRRTSPISNSIIVGIATNKDILRTRIEHRSEQLFADGIVEEAKRLGNKYGWNSEAMTGNIYPLVKQVLEGSLNEDELQQKFIIQDWRLAKRQLTWLKRNRFIEWHDLDAARTRIIEVLETWQ